MLYQYLVQNPKLAILIICIIAVLIGYIAIKIIQTVGMEKVRKTVYRAFVDAENNFKHGDNRAKFEYVIDIAKKSIPAPFNLFITENNLRKVIQLWFTLCKDLLDDGRVNGTGNDNLDECESEDSSEREDDVL